VRFAVAGIIPIGSLLGGVLGDAIGLRATLVVAVVGMLLAAVINVFSPLRHLRTQPEQVEDEEPALALSTA
jgi:predicted MFS family arabinose efflux permease